MLEKGEVDGQTGSHVVLSAAIRTQRGDEDTMTKRIIDRHVIAHCEYNTMTKHIIDCHCAFQHTVLHTRAIQQALRQHCELAFWPESSY